MGEHKLDKPERPPPDPHEYQPVYYWVKFNWRFTPGPLRPSVQPSMGTRFEEIGRRTPIARARDLMEICQMLGQKVFKEMAAMPGDNLQLEVEHFQRFEEARPTIAIANDLSSVAK